MKRIIETIGLISAVVESWFWIATSWIWGVVVSVFNIVIVVDNQQVKAVLETGELAAKFLFTTLSLLYLIWKWRTERKKNESN